MSLLINTYSTLRNPPKPAFPNKLNGWRNHTDPELAGHLDGFIGYILSRGKGEMTQNLYHVMRHIQRVQNHYSMTIEDDDLDAFSEWAWNANAISFLDDGTVRDPSGNVLVYPDGAPPDEEAQVPYPADAQERKARTTEQLEAMNIKVPSSLPPVVSALEVELRDPVEVAKRALALFVTAVRAESLSTNDTVDIQTLRDSWPIAFEALSEKESSFFKTDKPEQQDVVNFAWRYEALFLLEWALGLVKELPPPKSICDVTFVARTAIALNRIEFVNNSQLVSPEQILDTLDLHFRLNWAVRQARLEEKAMPADIEPGVVEERHYALNWLTGYERAEWDDVDTPT